MHVNYTPLGGFWWLLDKLEFALFWVSLEKVGGLILVLGTSYGRRRIHSEIDGSSCLSQSYWSGSLASDFLMLLRSKL